jgi:hypothetical protein
LAVFRQYQSIMSHYLHKIFTLSVFDTVQECIYNIYKASFSPGLVDTADYALVTSSLHYNNSLDARTAIHMAAAKFKPLIFSVSGFALSNVAKKKFTLITGCTI